MRPRALQAPAAALAALLIACGCSPGADQASQPGPADPPREVRASAQVEFVEPSADASPSVAPTPSSAATPSSAPTVEPAPDIQPSGMYGTSKLVLRAPEGGGVEVAVYVAADTDQRGHGLMEREDLADGTGMVFLFPRATSGAFYMYRTLIPLSIAFVRGDGTILSVLDMEPCTSQEAGECPLYPSGGRYRHALEVEQGFFDQIGLDTSWTVELADDLPTPS